MVRCLMALLSILNIIRILLIPQFNVTASNPNEPMPLSGAVLCLPNVYAQISGDCLPLGPSNYLATMAELGMTFPIEALPATKPDFAFNYLNIHYGEVVTPKAPVYGSIDDAIKGKKKNSLYRIDSSFSYISYSAEEIIDGKRFYMVEPGAWMTANDVSRITAPRFQGIELKRTPTHAFGWVLTYLSSSPVQTKYTPGNQVEDYTGRILNNHEIVDIYAVEIVADSEWYRIGPHEWVPENVIARVIPNTRIPKGIDGTRWIEVNLHEQTISVYDQHQLIFATLIASGLEPFWTRPGLFQIYDKLDTTPMGGSFEADRSDAYYLEDVPWTMYFDKARALHGAYWRANLGFPQSHGCVNMSVGDSRWIYEWAEVGDWVYVWDPSGKTPIDPDKYGEGGA